MAVGSSTPEDVALQARQRLEADVDARVEAVRRVAEAARDADEREQAARTAVAAHGAAWTAAVSAGWSDRDLRQMGLRVPTGTTNPTGRRRNRASAATDSSTSDASTEG